MESYSARADDQGYYAGNIETMGSYQYYNYNAPVMYSSQAQPQSQYGMQYGAMTSTTATDAAGYSAGYYGSRNQDQYHHWHYKKNS